MTSTKFTWISFYKELSDKLLTYRDRRDDLINKLATVFESIGMSLPKLEADELQDIDPFTVFGLFNKGITDANRQKIIAGIAEVFDIGANQPTDFEGIPVLNNLNATFYAFSGDDRRGENDIDNLWHVFEAELALAADDNEETRKAFVEAFDTTVSSSHLAGSSPWASTGRGPTTSSAWTRATAGSWPTWQRLAPPLPA